MITPVSHQRIEGMSRFAREHGWMLTIHDRLGGNTPSADYDGVLVTLRADERSVRYVRQMMANGIPVVDLTIQRPRIEVPRVVSDHRKIGFMAGEHFKSCGFRHAAWFSTGWSNVHALRVAGLADSMGNEPVKWIMQRDSEIVRTLKAAAKPVAVLVYDEAEAVHLLQLCIMAGLDVPDEIAVLSIGDDPLITDNQPVPISCIRQNFLRGGYEAAELLDRLMDGHRPPKDPILIPPDGITVRRSTDTVADDDPLIRGVLLYMRDNLHRPFGAEQVAAGIGVSRSRLDKACSARFGRSLGKEILTARLGKAKTLLKEGSLNIDEIAHATGFGASAYFIKKFKAVFGETPRKWRARQAKADANGFSSPGPRRTVSRAEPRARSTITSWERCASVLSR